MISWVQYSPNRHMISIPEDYSRTELCVGGSCMTRNSRGHRRYLHYSFYKVLLASNMASLALTGPRGSTFVQPYKHTISTSLTKPKSWSMCRGVHNIIQTHSSVLWDWEYFAEYELWGIFCRILSPTEHCCESESILRSMNVRNILQNTQSHRTLLWVWIMLWSFLF